MADALQWVVEKRGVRHFYHYFDDYITLGAPQSRERQENQLTLLQTCRELGVPVADHKCEGPTTSIEFLGIVVDSMELELKLSDAKIQDLKVELDSWRARKSCKKRKLLSLIGILNHACKVVRPGRSFCDALSTCLALVSTQTIGSA